MKRKQRFCGEEEEEDQVRELMEWENHQHQQQQQQDNSNGPNGLQNIKVIMTDEQMELLERQISAYAVSIKRIVETHKATTSKHNLTVFSQDRIMNKTAQAQTSGTSQAPSRINYINQLEQEENEQTHQEDLASKGTTTRQNGAKETDSVTERRATDEVQVQTSGVLLDWQRVETTEVSESLPAEVSDPSTTTSVVNFEPPTKLSSSSIATEAPKEMEDEIDDMVCEMMGKFNENFINKTASNQTMAAGSPILDAGVEAPATITVLPTTQLPSQNVEQSQVSRKLTTVMDTTEQEAGEEGNSEGMTEGNTVRECIPSGEGTSIVSLKEEEIYKHVIFEQRSLLPGESALLNPKLAKHLLHLSVLPADSKREKSREEDLLDLYGGLYQAISAVRRIVDDDTQIRLEQQKVKSLKKNLATAEVKLRELKRERDAAETEKKATGEELQKLENKIAKLKREGESELASLNSKLKQAEANLDKKRLYLIEKVKNRERVLEEEMMEYKKRVKEECLEMIRARYEKDAREYIEKLLKEGKIEMLEDF